MHVEHVESEDVVVPYWHVQNLWIGEARMQLARGIRKDLAVQLDVPFRLVRDRIRFEDLLRRPYTPPVPDVHHRNETLAHFSDASLALQWARVAAPWTIAAGAGVSLPIGRTESNPFALGRADLFALLGLSRSLAWGTWSADVRLPVLSHSESSQVKLPVIVHLGLSR